MATVRVSSTRVTCYDFLTLRNRLPARSRDLLGNCKSCPSQETWRFIFMFTRDHQWIFPEPDESSPHFIRYPTALTQLFCYRPVSLFVSDFRHYSSLPPQSLASRFNHDNYLETGTNLWEYPNGRDVKELLRLRVRIPRGHGCLSLVSDVFCHTVIHVTARSLVQRIPTGYGVSECCRETSQKRRPRVLWNSEKNKLWGTTNVIFPVGM